MLIVQRNSKFKIPESNPDILRENRSRLTWLLELELGRGPSKLPESRKHVCTVEVKIQKVGSGAYVIRIISYVQQGPAWPAQNNMYDRVRRGPVHPAQCTVHTMKHCIYKNNF